MEKQYKVDLWVEDGVTRVMAFFSNFDGDVAKWRDSFYEIWRYQMTYSFAYELTVHETSDKDICVDMLIKDAYKDNVKDMMEDLGYKNIDFWPEHIGIAQLWDIDDYDLCFVRAE